MTSDRELEQLMRATFANRAQTVTRGPVWTGAPELRAVPTSTDQWSGNRWIETQPPKPHRSQKKPNRGWIAAVAAAAAVVVIVGSVIVLRDRASNHVQPGTPAPSPSTPSATASRRPSATVSKHSAPVPVPACTTTLPSSWLSALRNSAQNIGGVDAQTLAVTSDGAIIAFRDDGVTPGSGRDVVRIEAGAATTTLYSVPDPDQTTVYGADLINDHWLVLGLADYPRPAKGVVTGSFPSVLSAIELVDLTSGQHTTLATAQNATAGLTIRDVAIFQGKVYWSELPSYTATSGSIRSYDPATGKYGTVYTGQYPSPTAAGAGLVTGIQTGPRVLIPATLPPIVENALDSFSRYRLSTDGFSYAWLVDQSTLGWWRTGQAAPTYVHLTAGQNTDDGGGTPLVAGNEVILGGGTAIVDMKTKAYAAIPASDYGSLQDVYFEFSADGVAVGTARTAQAGRFVNGYWEDTPLAVLRVDANTLGDITC